jgi:MoxR-like ATPase
MMTVDMAGSFGAAEPLADQAQLVEAQLELMRGRIRFALAERERRRTGEMRATEWPREFDEAEVRIAARVAATLAAGRELPITWLVGRLELGLDEMRVLWVLLAHEMCAVSRTMLRQINTETCPEPTADTLRLVAFGSLGNPHASRLFAAGSRLLVHGLAERTDTDANAADHRKMWKVAPRIAALAHGDTSMDPELFRIAAVVDPGAQRLGIGGEGIEADPDCLPALIAAIESGRRDERMVIVQGPRGTGRRSLLRAAAATLRLELIEIDVERIAAHPAQARGRIIALARECRLFDRVPLLRNLDALVLAPTSGDAPPVSPGMSEHLDQLVSELAGMLVLATTSSVIPGNRLHRPQMIEPRPLTGKQRMRLWQRALSTSPELADVLATMYPIAPALIDAAASVARAQLRDTAAEIDPGHIRIGLRAVLDGQLAGLATRIETTQRWESLVLPPEQRDAIDELITRVRHRRVVYEDWQLGAHVGRGLGVSALFSGPPGTGKTMAAGLIAQALATDIYQVDMSKIVSKWLGETEKNLARLFDAAEAGHAILLFDEADSLFGKRTDVRSSNDRYANQETNYLLSRLEAFRGVCILTTNHDTAIDDAFRRRLSLQVDFPMPDVKERTNLWRKMVPETVPVEGKLEFAALAARYEMSGGYIRNAVLRAAFFAAQAGTPLTNEHLQRAARLEYQAMGHL